MKHTLGLVAKIFGWIVLLAAFGALGFASDNPNVMVPGYFVFFLIVFSLVLLFNMRKQKRKESIDPKYYRWFNIGLGFLLLLLSILMPYFVFRNIGFTFMIYFLISLITLLLIAASIVAIRFINIQNMVKRLIGYAILIVISSVPALLMMQHDRSYHALGLAYYSAVIITVFAWAGISTLGKFISR